MLLWGNQFLDDGASPAALHQSANTAHQTRHTVSLCNPFPQLDVLCLNFDLLKME